MKKAMLVVILACGLLALPALSGAESYVGAYVGASIPHDADIENNTLSNSGVTADMSFDSGVTAGLKLGHWFNKQNAPFLGLEVDLNAQYPSTDKMKMSMMGFSADVGVNSDVNVYSAALNVLMRYPDGPLKPYIGAGGGWFFGEIDNGTFLFSQYGLPDISFRGEDDTTFGLQFLGGVDWLFLEPNLSLFVEYKYSLAEFEYGGDLGFDLDYNASQVYGGLTYHFQ